MADAARATANGLLAVVALSGGFTMMFRPYLGSSYASALELLPRFLLGGILGNTAGWWVQLAIDAKMRCAPSSVRGHRRIWRTPSLAPGFPRSC